MPISNNTLGYILKSLRENKNLTQAQFGYEFAKFMDRRDKARNIKSFSVYTVSAWENNNMIPHANTLPIIAQFYDVSLDYLYGKTMDKSSGSTAKDDPVVTATTYPLHYYDLKQLDGMPVYVITPENDNGYFIVDLLHQSLIGKDVTYKISRSFKYFRFAPPESITLHNKLKKILSLNEMMNEDLVIVESLSKNLYIKGQLDGVYHHYVINGEKKFLIDDNGNTLSYSGLGNTYNAVLYK